VYQGTELWDYSLVDPDNRRPVDFEKRREMLSAMELGPPPIDDTGAAKLQVVSQTLRLRWERPKLFTGYEPLRAAGPAAEHLVGFVRGEGNLIAVATRLPSGLARSGGWRDTALLLPQGEWTDHLTGRSFSGSIEVVDLLAQYPVSLLVRGGQ
jgi:(1->4)-alpha-D-glucan 1-alpha-D-glucosylmutase